ncbi:MAG: DJ-1/PfpI family protein [Candidatus Thorarchaeota archaeon]
MKSKALVLSLIAVLFCTGTFNTIAYSPSDEPVQIEDIKILALIDVSFGWNYFDIKDTLESWGINVTTVGTMAVVPSCVNREPRPVTSDIVLDDIDNDTILEFDGLIVPSGGHWNSLTFDTIALDLIATAHELGLYVAGICTGPIVLSRAGEIYNGTMIAGHGNGLSYYSSADAIRVVGARVVSDKRIVTGGSGSGFPSGFTGAPTNETCRTLVRDILGHSLISDCNLGSTEIEIGTDFQVNVELADLSTVEEGMFDYNVYEVLARVVNIANTSLYEEIELDETDGVYTGAFSGLESGEYRIDVQVEDDERIVSVYRNQTSFTLTEDPTTPTDIEIDPLLQTTIIAGVILAPVVIIAIFMINKRRM